MSVEVVAAYNQETLEAIAAEYKAAYESVVHTVQHLQAAANKLALYEPLSVAEQWVRTWGETVNKKTAAKMLGVSISQVNRLIANGDLVTTTSEDGRSRVIVRAAAEYVAMASRRIKPVPKVPMTRKGNPIRFIP